MIYSTTFRPLALAIAVSFLAAGCSSEAGKTPAGGAANSNAPANENGSASVPNANAPNANGVAKNHDESSHTEDTMPRMTVETSEFGVTPDGEKVTLYTCNNGKGLEVKMIDYGATVVEVNCPDRDGNVANVTLSYPTLAGYLERHPYFGSTVGRYCNRIAAGKFTIDGTEYELATNNEPNHLHGGVKGFDRVIWQAEPILDRGGSVAGVRFTYTSPDGEEGYPGKVEAVAEYYLTANNELVADFTAATDKPTHVNLTNHCYWNLAGAGSGSILDHELTIYANEYVPVDDTGIPTGDFAAVEGTPFDFRRAKAIVEDFAELSGDPGGYDHSFAVSQKEPGKEEGLFAAARLADPKSGRVLVIETNQPGIQFYTGNYLDGSAGTGGFKKNGALCLETQHHPDTPNQEKFPSTLLKPGEKYHHRTVHRFETK